MNVDRFHKIEGRLKFKYPPSFYALLSDFLAFFDTYKFKRLFPSACVCMESEILKAYEEGLRDDFFPFMVERNHSCNDYYCFDANSCELEKPVYVFSDHAIVSEWKNFTDFIVWMEEKLSHVPK